MVTSAFVGAGVVALGAASQIPDHKAVNPEVLKNLESAHVASDALTDRSATGHAASRGEDRSASVDKTKLSANEAEADVWMLPMEEFTFTSPYGVRWGKLHAGIDLADPQGTPFRAVHTGQVTQAGYNGGYGYSITVKNADGTEVIYAHARRLFVKAGDQVKAGQTIGEVGNTGASYGAHLHLEIHVNGQPTDPIPFLRQRGVDIKLGVESVYASMADAAS